MLLLTVNEQLLDDTCKLRVLVQRLLPILLEVLELHSFEEVSGQTRRTKERKRTRRTVDMYVASIAWPDFSTAEDSGPASLRLKPFHAAPRSMWSCEYSAAPLGQLERER
jgi:hypothetical protein